MHLGRYSFADTSLDSSAGSTAQRETARSETPTGA